MGTIGSPTTRVTNFTYIYLSIYLSIFFAFKSLPCFYFFLCYFQSFLQSNHCLYRLIREGHFSEAITGKCILNLEQARGKSLAKCDVAFAEIVLNQQNINCKIKWLMFIQYYTKIVIVLVKKNCSQYRAFKCLSESAHIYIYIYIYI